MMIRANRLSGLCNDVTGRMTVHDSESESALMKLASCLWATGSSADHITQILDLALDSYERGGRRAISGLMKGWSNAVRSILAVEPFDTTLAGFCKQARNCRFALRRLGASPAEVDLIVSRYDGVCGIPPLLLLPPYWRVLLGNAEISTYHRVIPLSNLGRASAIADQAKCDESEVSFFETTGRTTTFEFDLTHVGREYGGLCREGSRSSHIPLNSHSCYEFTRQDGGKTEYFIRCIVDSYLIQTVDQMFPERPTSDMFDTFGHLVLRKDDWAVGEPITSVMYPLLGSDPTGLDRRLGLFGLDWAIRELSRAFPGDVLSDSPYLTFGSFPPNLCFDGELPARVHTLAEEGFKARVITIVMLCVSIIQGVARYFLDDSMRTDKSVKIGLLSKVKLYDFMVLLNNGDRRGIDSFDMMSVFLRTAVSADLTCATDTPPCLGPRSLLEGYTQSICRREVSRFVAFAVEVGTSPRGFQSRFRPPGWSHTCGIMMGEGLSGTYLNVMSGIVRAIIQDFMVQFDFYGGSTAEDAAHFCETHTILIQDYLFSVPLSEFGQDSTQSGDDLILLCHHDPPEIKRFLILLYVVLGQVPSASTFYSSLTYGTFTEEAIIRTLQSHGWTFIDCIKPRLYSPSSDEGVGPVLSRISQVRESAFHLRHDDDYMQRVCDVIDTIIMRNRMLWDRVMRYNLVPAFPAWLGGLNHPINLMEGMEVEVPIQDRAVVMRLLACNLEELFEVKYSWATDDLPDDENAQEIRETLIRVFRLFQSLEEGEGLDEIIDLHLYNEEDLVDRNLFPSYNTYRSELVAVKNSLGLANLDELCEAVATGLRLTQRFDGVEPEEMNPLIQLRNRREVLISKTSHLENDGHDFSWSHIKNLDWRMKISYKGKFVLKDSFLDVLDLLDLPSLSVPIPSFHG